SIRIIANLDGNGHFPALTDVTHVGRAFEGGIRIRRTGAYEGCRLCDQFGNRLVDRGCIEAAEAAIGAAHAFEAERRAQEADGRADANARWDQELGHAELFAKAAGMDRRRSA